MWMSSIDHFEMVKTRTLKDESNILQSKLGMGNRNEVQVKQSQVKYKYVSSS